MANSAGQLLRTARERAGMTQDELGRRAGVTQSVVSAYESGRRQPSLPMLERLVAASGQLLDVRIVPAAGETRGRPSTLLWRMRSDVLAVAAKHGLADLRVFGSVARGEDEPGSDVDLLVEVPKGTTLWQFGAAEDELSSLLGAPVDLLPASDLKPALQASVLAEAVPL